MHKVKTTVRKTAARLAPGFVKIKFPTLQEAVANKNFHSCNIEEEIVFCDDDGNECTLPFENLGKEIVALKQFGGYIKKDGDKYIVDIPSDKVEMFHSIVQIIDGDPIDPPLNIHGDGLEYDEESKTFTVGCKTINHDLADKIFRFIGAKLGYEIT